MCLTLLPLRLLTSLIGIASANSTAGIEGQPEPGDFVVAKDPNDSALLQLWRADISVADDRGDDKNKNELRRMIEQIRSVRFGPQEPVPEPIVAPVAEAPTPEPKEALPGAPVQRQTEHTERAEPKGRLPYGLVTEQTLSVLRDLSANPEKVGHPFELGETLFLSGNLKEAAVFYTEALARTEPNDVGSSRDREWVLFQTGNCLRGSDPTAAKTMYTQLLTEYPNSPWTDIAKAQVRLVDWYLADEPHKLITDTGLTEDKW